MELKEISKEYNKGDLTIIWKPKLCIHAATCVKSLPQVYNPKEKPWIKAENATETELIEQIKKCPSGALTYRLKGESSSVNSPKGNTRVEIVKNGPILIHDELILAYNGSEKNTSTPVTALCRCGASQNKPYCDGAHSKINFEG